MVGQERLAQPKGGLEVANAVLSVAEDIEDPESSLIRKRVKHIQHAGIDSRGHSCISHAAIYQWRLMWEEGDTSFRERNSCVTPTPHPPQPHHRNNPEHRPDRENPVGHPPPSQLR
jgi:hypothetical protein